MAHILVIEDDSFRADWFLRVLTALGHEVRFAVDAHQALDQFLETAFDLVFFDYDLGMGNNGSQLLQAVITAKRYKNPARVWIHSESPRGVKNIEAKAKYAGIPYVVGDFSSCFRDQILFGDCVRELLAGNRIS